MLAKAFRNYWIRVLRLLSSPDIYDGIPLLAVKVSQNSRFFRLVWEPGGFHLSSVTVS